MTITAESRFLAKVLIDIESHCWLWQATKNARGYGRFSDGGMVYAHRWAYEHFVGPIPEGQVLLHGCDTTSCANPDHLEPGTQRENMAHLRTTRCRRCRRAWDYRYARGDGLCRPCEARRQRAKRQRRARAG